ncbi:hypothetical protein BOTBODRAFT_28756 [Botryobasidium botryosum FD-172 SS1]|uniref:Uncharacterized protein n=1 Tax=Botryobasidium botryosum (strain FD-172 SS1) TaxID=930990 RepID=A0A067N2L5_BOTB1|nr:hypothetical protein BOTBODRAFT_28756 [Botryobasidium botryosum FD-172 SS1]
MAAIPSSAKGKGRETATETTPLTQSSSSHHPYSVDSGPSTPASQESTRPNVSNYLYTVLVSTFSILLFGFLLLILIGSSYFNSAPALHQAPSEIVERSVAWQLDSVQVHEIQDDGLALLVSSTVRINTEWLIGISDDGPSGWWETLRKGVGRWGVRRLRMVTVTAPSLHVRSTSLLPSHKAAAPLLFNITVPSFSLNLIKRSDDHSSVTQLKLPVFIRPTTNTTDLLSFMRKSWEAGQIAASVDAARIHIQGGGLGDQGWRKLLDVNRDDIRMDIRIPIPPSPPNFPQPGTPLPPLASLIKLETYSLRPMRKPDLGNFGLGIEASASLPLPIPSTLHLGMSTTLPTLPFLVSLLPSNFSSPWPSTPVAHAYAAPRLIMNDPSNPHISVAITGTVLPLTPASLPLLSGLASNYLSALPSPILLTSLTPISMLRIPPVVAEFPAPPERPKIIRHIALRNMRVSVGQGGTTLTASGTIYAEIQLPPQMKDVVPLLDVQKVWPDALVYDGDPPVWGISSLPRPPHLPHLPHIPPILPKPPKFPPPSLPHVPHMPWTWPITPPKPAPLPDPLPEKAFARILPPEWLNATMLPLHEDDPEGLLRVRAHFTDIPFEVLPGRDAVFRAFISKVLFSHEGARAGIRGVAAIGLQIEGLDSAATGNLIELSGLPFETSVVIGKKDVLNHVGSKLSELYKRAL